MAVFIVCMVCIFLVGGMCVGLSGGGAGALMAAMGTVFLGPRESIAFAGFIMLAAHGSSALSIRRSIRWSAVALYTPGACIGGILGALALFQIPSDIIQALLGATCIAYVVFHKKSRRMPVLEKRPIIFLKSFVSGFLGGFIRNGRLVRSSFLLSLQLPPHVFVATSCAIAGLQLMGQTCVYATQIAWTQPFVLGTAGGMMIVPFGVRMGQKLLPKISAEAFERIQILLLMTSGLYLLISSLFR